jgi:hypothetical protein
MKHPTPTRNPRRQTRIRVGPPRRDGDFDKRFESLARAAYSPDERKSSGSPTTVMPEARGFGAG